MFNLKLLCREILTTLQSNRALADQFGISSTTVGRYRMRLTQEGLDADAIADWDDPTLDRRLNDGRYRNKKRFLEPDWAHTYEEMQRVGVDLRMLHEEYAEAHSKPSEGPPETVMSETEFRRRYAQFRRTRGLVMRMERRPGELLFVDYSGKRPCITNRETGEQTPVELFVGVMGASRKTFAVATYTQQLPDWIFANCQALVFYGCAPEAFVPDNLKSAVTKRTRQGVMLNPTYAEFAFHYGTSIRPARSRRPDDKAPVEVAVRIAQRYLLGRLRNRVFFSLEELNAAIAVEMERLNNKPIKSLGGKTRNQLFEELDRPAMKPLPAQPFVFGEWKLRISVGRDYHIGHDGRYYSVPYTLVGKKVDAKVLREAIEIYLDGQRIAVHPKVIALGGSSTLLEHRPRNHQAFAEAQPGEALAWATRMGEAIHRFAMADADRRRSPVLTAQLCQRLQALVRQYGAERVQAACVRALDLNLITITSLRSLLARGLDHVPASAEAAANDDTTLPAHENIRGASYYA
ncbi:MAG: IS21 family transposase [Pseudomonas veronii]|jgi:transposase|uniref:IS21 family transposase n=1 Tax=Pseudomonas veronii TaxID=76761 RepID=UPI003C73B21A